jgi:hypothetical protein
MVPAAAALFLLSLVPFAGAFRAPASWLGPLPALQHILAPLRIVNGYGLFAVMTTSRPEIIMEGSADGRSWVLYEFRYKPGDPGRRPPFVAPHQPRLDWQMWFAALGGYQRTPWVESFQARLLEGSPEVLGLLAENPFPGRPPRYVRATLWSYRFTSPEERRSSGEWWRREILGAYSPVVSLASAAAIDSP